MRTPHQYWLLEQMQKHGSVPRWFGSEKDWFELAGLVEMEEIKHPASNPALAYTECVVRLAEGVYER